LQLEKQKKEENINRKEGKGNEDTQVVDFVMYFTEWGYSLRGN
jgi:hypothetical protein